MAKKYFPPILWMAVIFALSSIPGSRLPKQPFPYFTELAHVAEYSILGILWYRVLKSKIFLILGISMLYAVSDEIHQLFVPFRQFSILDMAADTAGICIGVIVGMRLYLRKAKG